MRNGMLWLTFALAVTLAVGGRGLAQPPGDRGRPPGPLGPASGLERAVDDLQLSERKRETALADVRAYEDDVRRLTALANSALLLKMKAILSEEEYRLLVEATDRARGPRDRRLTNDDVVARLMSFDKNGDGKITKDELPERMQDLIERGDTNKDGALDRDEIKQLATELARGGGRFGLAGGFPRGAAGRGDPGDGIPAGAIERAVNDLQLAEKTKEAAAAAVKAHHENIRQVTELARADLVLKMTDVLSAEELKKLEAALDRPPGPGPAGPGGRGPGGFGPGGPPAGGPEPGTVLGPLVRERLKLTGEQETQLADLQKEATARLMKILTDEQKKTLEEMRDRGPADPPPGRPGPRRPPR
jgi:Spy/CpxP family protein refolding chaperone